MSNSLLWLALPAVVMLAGGALTAVWRPSESLVALVQHVAAGVILGAITIEVFPEMRREDVAPLALLASFSVGALFMFGVKRLGIWLEARSEAARGAQGLNYGFLIAVFLDAVLDGVTIGAGFSAEARVGFALALGLSIEMLFLGMSLISDTLHGARVFWLCASLGLTILVTAALGYWTLSSLPRSYIAIALAFCAAALLYLVTEELLIEAHTHTEKPYAMLVLFAGFAGFWAISLL
jgi:zinc transporter, ZIP family